jgi:tyrosyl-DNA phosphodiesterase-1
MQVVNYELGIMLPLRDEQAASNIACWERPPKKYRLGRDLPWVSQWRPDLAERLLNGRQMQEESVVLRNN